METVKKIFGVCDAAPMSPGELDLRLLKELSDIWKGHVRRYVQDCKAIKIRAAADRDIGSRYKTSFEYQYNLQALHNAFQVWRKVRADAQVVWREYMGT